MVATYVSIYVISKEMYLEDEKSGKLGKKSKTDEKPDFVNYYKEQLRHLSEIFEAMGANAKVLKDIENGDYMIPLKQKAKIKLMLRSYTTSTMKKIRKGYYDQIPAEELGKTVAMIEAILKDRLDDDVNKYTEQRDGMYRKTRYPLLKTISEMRTSVLAQILSDMESMKQMLIHEMLNDVDKVYLLKYYQNLLDDASRQWREVANIVRELRTEEIAEISMMMVDGSIEESTPLQELMDDTPLVIWEALDILRQEGEDILSDSLNKLTSEQLKQAAELIDKLKNK